MTNRLSVKLSDTAMQVMQLDDSQMCHEYNIEVDYSKKRVIVVTGSADALRDLRKGFANRAEGAAGGWDQPASWARVSAAAVRAINAALVEHDLNARLKRREGRAPQHEASEPSL